MRKLFDFQGKMRRLFNFQGKMRKLFDFQGKMRKLFDFQDVKHTFKDKKFQDELTTIILGFIIIVDSMYGEKYYYNFVKRIVE